MDGVFGEKKATCINPGLRFLGLVIALVLQPYFGPSVGVKPNTPKVGNLESSRTPECLELNSKAQNTSH
jgi:hypothetical protein